MCPPSRRTPIAPHTGEGVGETTPAAVADERRLIVTGNPNVGKNVIFQLLTGRYATVSNYPGTTVMVASGSAVLNGQRFRICDTPGLNSVQASSEDELVARNLLLSDHPTVLQVSDAKNLLRALALTLELAEAGLSTVLNLNMVDEARERRIAIDTERLGHVLGVPVVSTIATQRWGVERLRRAVGEVRVDSESTIKRFYRSDDRITLAPDSTNAKQQPMVFTKKNEVMLRGVVEAVWMKRVK